jgi:hypothetical protein
MYGDLQGLIGTSLQAIPALVAGEEEDSTEGLPEVLTVAVRGEMSM